MAFDAAGFQPSLAMDVPSFGIDACDGLFDAHANLGRRTLSLYIWTTCSAIFTPCSAISGRISSASLRIAGGVPAALHAILTKRDSRAVIGWVGVIWLTPIGSLLYWVLGINRIQRRAKLLRGGQDFCVLPPTPHAVSSEMLCAKLGSDANRFIPFVQLVGELAEHPLVAGNRVTPLISGDEAYPAMLAAIDEAQEIGLALRRTSSTTTAPARCLPRPWAAPSSAAWKCAC